MGVVLLFMKRTDPDYNDVRNLFSEYKYQDPKEIVEVKLIVRRLKNFERNYYDKINTRKIPFEILQNIYTSVRSINYRSEYIERIAVYNLIVYQWIL